MEAQEQAEFIEKLIASDPKLPGHREQPLSRIVQLFRISDPRLRSRAARVVGRYIGYRSFVEHRMNDENARVRANAVESLWAVRTPEALSSLVAAAADLDQRVRTNALIGMYLQGEKARALELLLDQAAHRLPTFRASAAWALGHLGDLSVAPRLQELALDDCESVRLIAADALAKINVARAQSTQTQDPALTR